MEKDIKDYREKELRNYVIANILLVLLATGKINEIADAIGSENLWDAIDKIISSGVIAALVYIYIFLMDSLVPSSVKDKLIWLKSGLPSSRVFTVIKTSNNDKRFTIEEVMAKYPNVYDRSCERNNEQQRNIESSTWYGAYQRNEASAQVYVSNRDWLLCRDMFVMSIWITILFFAVTGYLKLNYPPETVILIIFEVVSTWGAARLKSKRFVYNVIAKDVHKKDS